MKHLTPLELGRLLDAELADRDLERVERHLGECAACRDALAAFESQDTALRSALTHDPGDDFFERFAVRVEERIRATPNPAPLPERRSSALGWLGSPRGLAWMGGVAAIVVGAGVVFLTARENGVEDLRRPALMRGQSQVESPEASRLDAPPSEEDQRSRAPASEPKQKLTSPSADGATLGATSSAPRNQAGAREDEAARDEKTTVSQSAPNDLPAQESAPPVAKQSPTAATRVKRTTSGEDVPQRKNESRSSFATPPPTNEKLTEGTLTKPGPQPLAPAPTTASSAEKKEAGARGGAETGALSLDADGRDAGTLCGTVRDRAGRPVPGAVVAIADLGRTVVTDRAGHFCLAAPAGTRTLSVMALGFQEVRRPVEVRAGRVESDVTLDPVAVVNTPFLASKGRLLDRAASDISTWPAAAREPARQAQAKMDRAAAQRSAGQFDGAAGDWERVLDRVRGYDAAETEVRSRLAESRYRAWQLAPTNGRRMAATDALTAYLVRAPMGAARDSAAKRLDRVKQ